MQLSDNPFLPGAHLCALFKFQEQTFSVHRCVDWWNHIRLPNEQMIHLPLGCSLQFEINWHFSLQFPLLGIHHFTLCPLGPCVNDQERFNASTFDCSFWTLMKYRVCGSPCGHFIRVNDGRMKGPHEHTWEILWVWRWARQTTIQGRIFYPTTGNLFRFSPIAAIAGTCSELQVPSCLNELWYKEKPFWEHHGRTVWGALRPGGAFISISHLIYCFLSLPSGNP